MKDWDLLLQPRYCYWNMDAKEATCRAPQGHHCSEGREGQWGKLVLNSEFNACSPPGFLFTTQVNGTPHLSWSLVILF